MWVCRWADLTGLQRWDAPLCTETYVCIESHQRLCKNSRQVKCCFETESSLFPRTFPVLDCFPDPGIWHSASGIQYILSKFQSRKNMKLSSVHCEQVTFVACPFGSICPSPGHTICVLKKHNSVSDDDVQWNYKSLRHRGNYMFASKGATHVWSSLRVSCSHNLEPVGQHHGLSVCPSCSIHF